MAQLRGGLLAVESDVDEREQLGLVGARAAADHKTMACRGELV
jgi:hypothetical protein